jgi:hypothetical protein
MHVTVPRGNVKPHNHTLKMKHNFSRKIRLSPDASRLLYILRDKRFSFNLPNDKRYRFLHRQLQSVENSDLAPKFRRLLLELLNKKCFTEDEPPVRVPEGELRLLREHADGTQARRAFMVITDYLSKRTS